MPIYCCFNLCLIENIEKSKEQKRLGLYKHTSEVHKLIQEKHGIILDK